MAEGILRRYAPPGLEVVSAGTAPTSVRPEAIEALREIGIDISGQVAKHVDTVRAMPYDYLITVCDHARESCPVLSQVSQQLHWSLPDPVSVPRDAERQQAFREVRDSLVQSVRAFVRDLSIP